MEDFKGGVSVAATLSIRECKLSLRSGKLERVCKLPSQ
jgi:hypothetical protein